jgi:peptidoglycan/LPS O-acetylase OafA/YrhL
VSLVAPELDHSTPGVRSAASPLILTPFTMLYARLKVFDGLRAISILWVVFHHVPAIFPAGLEAIKHRGYLGVDLFFAVSGFLVTRSLSQCMDRDILREVHPLRNAVQDFFIRRVSRIFPPFFFVLFVLIPATCIVNTQFRERIFAVREVLWGFPFFLSNYLIPISKNLVPNALQITWSLSFEEQFYCTLLLMFLVGRRRHLPYWMMAAGLGSLIFRMVTVMTVTPPLRLQEIQMPLHFRFDALMWASLAWLFYEPLSWLWKNQLRAKIVNIFISIGVLGSFVLTTWRPGSQWQAIVYCFSSPFYALMIRAFCEPEHQKSWLVRSLSTQLLVAIGIVSYEIYLIHVLVIGLLGSIGFKNFIFVYGVSVLFFSFIMGWMIHRYFSKPIEQWMRIKFSPRVW